MEELMAVVAQMASLMEAMGKLKGREDVVDPRCLNIAYTNVEQGMLWLANGVPDRYMQQPEQNRIIEK